jgi:hypothetical protein
MRNFFTRQDVPPELTDLTDKTLIHSVMIDYTQPGFYSYLHFRGQDPNTETITENFFKELPIDPSGYVGNWRALQTEINFLEQLGLIVETGGKRYVSPLAIVFYGEGGLFEKDFELTISSLATPEDRLEFLTPVLNLFAKFVLPGRVSRVTSMRGVLPDSVHYGHALTQEVAEMESMLEYIRGLL